MTQTFTRGYIILKKIPTEPTRWGGIFLFFLFAASGNTKIKKKTPMASVRFYCADDENDRFVGLKPRIFRGQRGVVETVARRRYAKVPATQNITVLFSEVFSGHWKSSNSVVYGRTARSGVRRYRNGRRPTRTQFGHPVFGFRFDKTIVISYNTVFTVMVQRP